MVELGLEPGDLTADPRVGYLFVLNHAIDRAGHQLVRGYPDGWWPQLVRRVKGWAGWLPFQAPAPPQPPTNATVMMLDLTKL